jgi:hypothetical protein
LCHVSLPILTGIVFCYGGNHFIFRQPKNIFHGFSGCLKFYFTLNRAFQHNLFDFANRTRWVQMFRTHVHAIHNRVATEQTVWVVQIVQTLIGNGIAAVGDETVGVQQTRRTYEFIGVPPE